MHTVSDAPVLQYSSTGVSWRLAGSQALRSYVARCTGAARKRHHQKIFVSCVLLYDTYWSIHDIS